MSNFKHTKITTGCDLLQNREGLFLHPLHLHVLLSCLSSISPTTVVTSCLWERRSVRTVRFSRETWRSAWSDTSPHVTNDTRKNAVSKRWDTPTTPEGQRTWTLKFESLMWHFRVCWSTIPTSIFFLQQRGSDTKEDGGGDKPRRNVSWQDKGYCETDFH